jgi:phosphate transport system permease protein
MIWRRVVNTLMFGFTALCTLLTVATLFFILGALIYHGARSLNWAFFTRLPVPVGETGGGMANAIVGTAKLLLLTILMGVPAGFIGGVYLAEFGGAVFSSIVRYTADLLNGAPSIVIGILAYALVVMSLIVIPITLRSTEQFLRAVPLSLREGALALGASKWKAVVTVVIPAAMRGVLTGTILGVARVAGETAPLLFTAFGNPYWSPGWLHPSSALPMMVYTYGLAPYEDWHRQAWAAGLVLLVMMLVANVAARLVLSPRGAQSA